jgi:hypothetical protein
MVTQSRTKTVPYGFICGFPVGGVSSELYGFYEGQGGKSGAQGDAVLAAMKKWGENEAGTAGGTELGFAVCKRGYRPFGEDGERRFGCVKHSARRLEAMRRAPPCGSGAAAAPDPETGLYHRPGWERFDQWVFGEKTTSGSTAPSESRSAEEEEDQDAGAASRSPPREKKRSRLAVAATA